MNDVQDIQDLRSYIVWDGFLNVFHYPALALKPEHLAAHSSNLLLGKPMKHKYTEFSWAQLGNVLCAVSTPFSSQVITHWRAVKLPFCLFQMCKAPFGVLDAQSLLFLGDT